jgi:hypothetical protein
VVGVGSGNGSILLHFSVPKFQLKIGEKFEQMTKIQTKWGSPSHPMFTKMIINVYKKSLQSESKHWRYLAVSSI